MIKSAPVTRIFEINEDLKANIDNYIKVNLLTVDELSDHFPVISHIHEILTNHLGYKEQFVRNGYVGF